MIRYLKPGLYTGVRSGPAVAPAVDVYGVDPLTCTNPGVLWALEILPIDFIWTLGTVAGDTYLATGIVDNYLLIQSAPGNFDLHKESAYPGSPDDTGVGDADDPTTATFGSGVIFEWT